jgi:hypothetical protein
MRRTSFLAGMLTTAALLAAPVAANAQLLVNQYNAWSAFPFGYGNSANTVFTAILDAAFGGPGNITTQNVALSGTGAYSALILELRGSPSFDPPLLASEVAELTAFLNAGGRVLAFGDYQNPNYVNSFLNPFGGSFGAPLGPFSPAVSILGHSLTSGVGLVEPAGAATIIGGTQLFNVPFAALFGPSHNFLALNDVNICADNWIHDADNLIFCNNVAGWLAAGYLPVPEPSGLFLAATGLLGLVLLKRRREDVVG